MNKLSFFNEVISTVMDYSLDLFAYLDKDNHYQFVSKSYANFYDFENDDLIGKKPEMVFDIETYEQVIEPNLSRCWQEAKPVNFQAWIMPKKANSPCYLYTTYLPHIAKETGEVVGVIVIAKDVTEFKRAEGLLSKSANTDALTNIPNRLFLENKLSSLTKSTARRSDRFALLFCDLDGFKQVNDNFGHAVGDKILFQVAHRLNKLVRTEDILARYGGDEFAILISPLVDENIIPVVKQKIEDVISKPYDISGNRIELGISIGVAIYPDEVTSKEELLEIADKRMYTCKNAKNLKNS